MTPFEIRTDVAVDPFENDADVVRVTARVRPAVVARPAGYRASAVEVLEVLRGRLVRKRCLWHRIDHDAGHHVATIVLAASLNSLFLIVPTLLFVRRYAL